MSVAARTIAAGLLTFAAAFAAEPAKVLTPDGLGPVTIGMTTRQAEAALGAKLVRQMPNDADFDSCDYLSRRDGQEPDVAYMLSEGHIARVDIDLPRLGPRLSTVKTAEGIGIGSTEKAVKQAYGGQVKVEPHPYGDGSADGWHYLRVDQPDHRRGYIFETDGKRVTSFRAGRHPELDLIEGCS